MPAGPPEPGRLARSLRRRSPDPQGQPAPVRDLAGARPGAASTEPATSGRPPTEAAGGAPTEPGIRAVPTGHAAPVAPPLPPPAPSLEPAAAFLQRLAEGPAPAVRPLEPAFQPLAAVVAGTTDVRIATGPTVARALGEVGRRAATVGRTIHLAQEPRDAPADLSVLGHELAHVGAAGVRPRFLGGPPDAEERRAHRVAGVVDAASRGGTRGLRVGSGALAGRTVHRIVQRAVDEALRRRPAPETTRTPEPARPEPKAAPVQQVVQFAPSTEETVVRRSPVIQRGDDPPSPGAAGRGVDFDRILEALEERVLSELERRGGRLVEVI